MLKTAFALTVIFASLTAHAGPAQVIDGLRGKASLSPDFPTETVPHDRDRGAFVAETIAAHVLFEQNGITETMIIAGLRGQGSLAPDGSAE